MQRDNRVQSAMHQRLQTVVYGAVLAVICSRVLYLGKEVLVPIVFGILLVYAIVGLARAMCRVPYLGRLLPLQARYIVAVLVIALGLLVTVYLVIANREQVLALAPQYQQSLLAAIQKLAVYFRIESEPTWATLRQDILTQINIQKLIGWMLSSVSSLVVTFIVAVLYATFLLIEQRSFAAKLANISTDRRQVERVREIMTEINARVGSYLALKTFLGILLGAISWAVMAFIGLEFAALWAVLIALLNYIPYVGSFLGVLLPVTMSIVQFGNPSDVFAVLLPLTVVQFLIGNFLDPYLMGNSLNLSPFAILVSLAIWSELWGIAGAFLAVPITAILAIFFSEFAATRPLAVLLSRDGRL